MGNSDSQASIPGAGSTSFVLPRKPKSYSLRFRPAKQKVLSARSWWRGREVNYRSRTHGSGVVTQQQTNLSCTPHHYDCFANVSDFHIRCQSGEKNVYGIEGAYSPKEVASPWTLNVDTHRALFTEQDSDLQRGLTGVSRSSGPVHLLRFSSAMPFSAVVSHSEATPQPPLRTSKGSSLSSEGSWYDSPWGVGGELSDADRSCSSGHTEDICSRDAAGLSGQPETKLSRANRNSSILCANDTNFSLALYTDSRENTNSSNLIEQDSSMVHSSSSACSVDYSIGTMALQAEQMEFVKHLSPVTLNDLNRNPKTVEATDTFPSSCDFPARFLDFSLSHSRASCTSVMEERPGVREFASYTLPCRRAAPAVDCSAGKSTLRSRIRRFSDWTETLSRKKRKLQGNDPESVDSGVDVCTTDAGSPFPMSGLPWYQGSCQASPSQGAPCTHSFPALGCRGDEDEHGALRQNIYDTFMRELETVHDGGGGEVEQSEGTAESSSSSSSGGSLEQLDELLEKEQGLVRRAGWLSFKPLITLHKDRRLELVPRRRWRHYWVTLKGCTLLFYETFEKSLETRDSTPRYVLFVEDSVVQAVPEHPKKENVFCLSNTYGDVYLFQAANQTDVENWVTAVHSACASLLARRHGKEDTVRLLQNQTRNLLQEVDMDTKMKKMAELQLSVVSDQRNRKAIENQIQQWEQNLERFNMDLFRVRCYLSSLQGGELPNPKILLAASSRASKMALGRVGIFSVSSFHALVCSRDEATLRRRSRSMSRGTHGRHGLFSLKGLDTLTRRGRDKKQPVLQNLEHNCEAHVVSTPTWSLEKSDTLANLYSVAPPEGHHWDCSLETPTRVLFLNSQAVKINIKHDYTVSDVLTLACKVKHLDPNQHRLFMSTGVGMETEFRMPAPGDLIHEMLYDTLLAFPLNVFSLCLIRPSDSADYGFAVTGHVDGSRNSHIFVSEVLTGGVAYSEGLRPGDEVLVVNGTLVSTLDLDLMQTHFSQQRLSLVLWREEATPHDHDFVQPHVRCQDLSPTVPPLPPPSQLTVMQDVLHQPCDVSCSPEVTCCSPGPGSEEALQLCTLADGLGEHSQSMEAVSTLLAEAQESPQGAKEFQDGLPQGTPHPPCSVRRPPTERLCKVIQELMDTEKSYVKDLSCLFEIYLKPLQHQTFLSMDEMESLFGSLPEMLDFQRVFLQTLEEGISSSSDFSTLETPEQLKKLLFSLGGSFLYYADHFKLYSGFCANHMKVQKVLERAKTDQSFKGFLDAKNPTKQHSSTLESYLIKPVQRVLRYPLLLRELVSLTHRDSEEHRHLSDALKAMEMVASHINEMQKIYEEYGMVFDQLLAEQSAAEKEITEISMGDFLIHSSVLWLNPLPSLGRMRKDPELTVFVFRKAVVLVYRESGRVRKRMTATRPPYCHGDMDPFKFRWLIPLSALHLRPGGGTAGSEADCVWELIHTKSEVAGRPETVFQLCSSTLKAKGAVVKVIRSLLREGGRRPGLAYRGREPLGSTRSMTGSSKSSWLRKEPYPDTLSLTDAPRGGELDSSEGIQSCTPQSSGVALECRIFSASEEQSQDSQQPLTDTQSGVGTISQAPQQESLTSTIEAQLQRLWIVEDSSLSQPAPRVQPELVELDTPIGHSLATPMPVPAASLYEDCGVHVGSVPLDTSPGTDFRALERDFSVQSLTSVVNEEFFYDKDERCTFTPAASGQASSCLASESPSHRPLTDQQH